VTAVVAGRQLPGVRSWVSTSLLFKPKAGLNAPVNPVAVHAARASPTVRPTRSGTVSQSGVGVALGAGAGVALGVGGGIGVGAGLGLELGVGVACGMEVGVGDPSGAGDVVGVVAGVGAAVGLGRGPGVADVGRLVGVGVERGATDGLGVGPAGPAPSTPGAAPWSFRGGVAVAAPGDGSDTTGEPSAGAASPACAKALAEDRSGPTPRPSGASTAVGVPRRSATAPVGASGPPMKSATAMTAMTATPATTAVRRSGWRGFRGPVRPNSMPAVAPAVLDTPHPGHAPLAPTQHRSHAWMPQSWHRRSPTCARVATGPMRLPHRSQNGIRGRRGGASLKGPGVVGVTRARAREPTTSVGREGSVRARRGR
jgi:hypothetical protein